VLASARNPILPVALVLIALAAVASGEGGVTQAVKPSPSEIVIGFVGGFVRSNDLHHGPVQLAQRIEHDLPKDAYVQVFENRHRKTAYATILHLLDRDHDGVLSDEEKSQARIVLFGHSWGASAAVLLARELERVGVPVLLTVQVDSVAKLWQKDAIIPANVAEAVNFYQPHGIIHGRKEIVAQDPAKTRILGNYRFDYRQQPVKCEGTSWSDRTFTPSHMQIECDPHIWNQVEQLVVQQFQPQPATVAVSPIGAR
jgi:pimeloyl-ACP methyl ester carboxylesterase